MLSFIEFLQEKINFAKGRDNDFFYHNYAIITLVKGDINKYKVEGKRKQKLVNSHNYAF